MKNRLSRKLLILLAIVALLAVTACTSNNGNGDGNAPAGTNDSGNKQPAADDGSDKVNPVSDEPGWQTDTSPIKLDWYVNFSWMGTDWQTKNTLDYQYIVKKTGVSVNLIVPSGNETEKMNTMIASGKIPDIITLGWSEDAVQQLIDGGLVLPLNKLAEEYDPYFFKVADPAKLSWYTQPDGNVYGWPNSSSSPGDYAKYGDTYTSNQTFIVRKDMYEAIGSPDMRTPEGFLGALQKAKEMFPTVNGQPLIPIGFHEFSDIGNYSFLEWSKMDSLLMNFLAIPMQKDGKLYDRMTDPEYVKWLKTFRKANEMGLISKDVFIDKRAQIDEKATQGRYFAMMYQAGDLGGPQATRYAEDPNSVYIAVDGPSNAAMDKATLYGPGISGWTLTLISKDVKDKARAIKFLSYLISEEGQRDIYLGEKGVTWDTIDGKDQFLPAVLEEKQKDSDAYSSKYGIEGGIFMMMDPNITAKWTIPLKEPELQPKEWTKGKVQNFSQQELINPAGSSDEGIIWNSLGQEWGKVLPQLILAKDDAEFDSIFNKFIAFRDKDANKPAFDYRQKRFEENGQKLDQFAAQ